MKRTCVDCGKAFEITPSEEQFYHSKGYNLPKRCKACRDNRNGKNLITVKENRPILINISITLIVATIVFVFFTKDTLNNNTSVIICCIVSAILSLLCLIFSRKTKEIDFSFNSKYKYGFYDAESLYTHYKKHGRDTKCKSAEEYLIKANNVIENRNAIHKQTVDDDTTYYIVPTGEFVVVSPAKYIRTYYRTDYKYYLKQ